MYKNASIYRMVDRISWVLWSRVVFLGVMATSAVCLNYFYGDSITRPVLLAVLTGLSFSFVSRLLIHLRLKKLGLLVLAYSQIIADAILTSFLIYETGGLHSGFILLYGLNILSGGVLLFTRGVLTGLLVSILGYAFVVFLSSGLNLGFELARFVFVMSVLILVGSLVAVLFRNREHLIQSLEKTSSDLLQLMELQSAIVGSIPSGVLILSEDDRVVYSNPSATQILGTDCTGKNGVELGFAFDPKEISLSKPDGQTATLLIDSVNLDSGKRLVVLTDISHLRKLEVEVRVREKLAGVGQLAAGLAHEIKNPLASLSGSIQLLQKEEQNHESKDKLMEIILRETDRLDELLNGFLNYAKPSQIRWQETLLNSIVEEVVGLLKAQPSLDGHKVRFHLELAEKTLCVCDPAKIRQVLWNLMKNAVSALKNEGDIYVRLRPISNKVRIEVEDTGEGIPESIQPRIFEPFFTQKPQGTGLGLALVYQIVDAHAGKVGFESKHGSGSLFWVELERDGRSAQRSAA